MKAYLLRLAGLRRQRHRQTYIQASKHVLDISRKRNKFIGPIQG